MRFRLNVEFDIEAPNEKAATDLANTKGFSVISARKVKPTYVIQLKPDADLLKMTVVQLKIGLMCVEPTLLQYIVKELMKKNSLFKDEDILASARRLEREGQATIRDASPPAIILT